MRDARCLITIRYCHKAFTQVGVYACCCAVSKALYPLFPSVSRVTKSGRQMLYVGCNSAISRSHSSVVFPFSSSPFSAIHSGSNGRDCYFYCASARNPREGGSELSLSLAVPSDARCKWVGTSRISQNVLSD